MQCGNPYHPRLGTKARSFCSRSCYSKARGGFDWASYGTLRDAISAGIAPADNGCWVWRGGTKAGGYGRFDWRGSKYLVHRFVFEECFGELPTELFVCHKCDNPLCCNPAHMFAGTHQDNMDDMTRKGRNRRGEASPAAKLRVGDVASIRELLGVGLTHREIAARFSVARETVSRIAQGINWRH